MNGRRYLTSGLLILTPLFGLIALLSLGSEIGQPFGGFVSAYAFGTDRWHVDVSTPDWWPGVGAGELRYGDDLLTIDGQPYGDHAGQAYQAAAARQADQVELTVLRDGASQIVAVPVSRFSWEQFLDLELPEIIGGLVFWALGLLVYRTNPRSPLNRTFAIACALVAGYRWFIVNTLFPAQTLSFRLLDVAIVAVTSLIGPTLVYFALIFPRPVRRMRPATSVAFIVGLVSLASAMAARPAMWLGRSTPFTRLADSLGLYVAILTMLTGVFLLLARPARLFWHAGGSRRAGSARRERRQMGLVLVGFLFALPLVAATTASFLPIDQPQYGLFWSGLDLRYMILAVPLAFSLAILRYQAFETAHPIYLGVLHLASSAFFANAGTWVLHKVPSYATAPPMPAFLLFFVLLLAAGLAWQSQSSWRGFLGRLSQWERRGYAAARQFGHQMDGVLDQATLPQTIVSRLAVELELEKAALWLWQPEDKSFVLKASAGDWRHPPSPLRPDDQSRCASMAPVRLGAPQLKAPAWLVALTDADIQVVLPLFHASDCLGLLALGNRWDQSIFDARDLQVMELVAQQAGLFLLVGQQVAALRQVPARIAQAQERERQKIAHDLHDTVQQFLGRLPFYLEVSRQAARDNPAETERILSSLLVEVESAARALRQIQTDLTVAQGLAKPLTALIEDVQRHSGLDIHLSLDARLDEATAPETQLALYRVVQQALDNVVAHAAARTVELSFWRDADRLLFHVQDDGQGSTAEQRAAARSLGRLGLQTMPARIEAIGGAFRFESEPGQGTHVSGWVPLKRGETKGFP